MTISNGMHAWMVDALCAEVGDRPFFLEKGESATEALNLCRNCDVTAACLEYALNREIRHGIFGGKLPKQRARIIARRHKDLAA